MMPQPYTGRWIEPFMGTGVVAFNVRPQAAIMADTNPHLIAFYKALQKGEITPDKVRAFLQKEGAALLKEGESHYYKIRERFNSHHHPLDFLFLNRACFNGMIRFNRKGGFNVPFCRKPHRYAKAYITKIVNQVAYVYALLQRYDYTFLCQDFTKTIAMAGPDDVIYCDPPYIGRHADYFNGWDEDKEVTLFRTLKEAEATFILSTWHHNDYRENPYIASLWGGFDIATCAHFYHIGGKENHRNPMVEALVTNGRFTPTQKENLVVHAGCKASYTSRNLKAAKNFVKLHPDEFMVIRGR